MLCGLPQCVMNTSVVLSRLNRGPGARGWDDLLGWQQRQPGQEEVGEAHRGLIKSLIGKYFFSKSNESQ